MIIQKRNKIVPFVEMMNIENVIRSKVSQKEKNKYCIFNAYMWNLEKNSTDEPIFKAEIGTQTQRINV